MTPCENQNTTFFEKLQQSKDLDLRDRRGRRHDLAVVLISVAMALLSNRDGNLSSIHRYLQNHHGKLAEVLGLESRRAVSRAQLPLILEKVSVRVFDQLLFAHYGVRLNEAERHWFAIDGKELRGSIESGEKRGEAIVQAINHESGNSAANEYYSGDKESEVPAVRWLMKQNGLAGQKISFDALHCKPQTLEPIASAGGKYLVGLKANQKGLFQKVSRAAENQVNLFSSSGVEKGHGRIEARSYEFYDILELAKDERWQGCQLKTAIRVERKSEELKNGKRSFRISYYLTNEVGNYEELCRAVRSHWQVETNNHLRDVSLKEDHLQSKKRICNE